MWCNGSGIITSMLNCRKINSDRAYEHPEYWYGVKRQTSDCKINFSVVTTRQYI